MKFKKIARIEQYNMYCDLHEQYGLENPDKYKDEMDLLEILIDEFDSRTNEYNKKMNPVEILKSILEDENMTKSSLANSLGTSRQLIGDILRYKRNISKDKVTKLSEYFKMRPEAFSRPYKLKNRYSKRFSQTI